MELDIEHLKSRILLQQGSSHKCQSCIKMSANYKSFNFKRPRKKCKDQVPNVSGSNQNTEN